MCRMIDSLFSKVNYIVNTRIYVVLVNRLKCYTVDVNEAKWLADIYIYICFGKWIRSAFRNFRLEFVELN